MKKARSDSKLKLLPPERQEQIIAWANTPKSETCVGGLAYAMDQLKADGIKVAMSTLGEFVSWYRLQQRFSRASSRAEQVLELAKQQSLASPKELQDFAESVFTLEAVESKDAETYVNLQHLRLKRDSAQTRFEIDREKLKIAERRVQVAERKLDNLKGILTDGALSPEERERRMKQQFGIA